MNIAQLRTFVAVVEQGSFSAAGRVLGISQPAVTMQIQSIESELGVTLLDRRYRRVEVTEAGRVLLPHARAVLEEVELAREDMERLAGSVTGHLSLAVSTTPGQYILPRLLGSFLRDNPDVTVSLGIHDTAEVVRLVEAGEAQLGMTGARMTGARVEFEAMGVDRLVVVCPPDGPLAGRKDLTLAEVAEQPFITRECGSGTRMVFEDTLRAAGIDPADLRVVLELGTSEAIVNAVEGGMGVGVVSSWMAEKALALGTVAQLDVPHFPVERPLFAVTPKGTPRRAAEELLVHLRASLVH